MLTPLIPQRSPIVRKTAPGTDAWCSCGRSANQPFCDGAHGDTGFKPQIVKIEREREVAWCACKHSQTKPFCDGTHHTLK